MTGAIIYPKIALFFFLLIFLAMIWFAFRADKKYIKELAQLPLD